MEPKLNNYGSATLFYIFVLLDCFFIKILYYPLWIGFSTYLYKIQILLAEKFCEHYFLYEFYFLRDFSLWFQHMITEN